MKPSILDQHSEPIGARMNGQQTTSADSLIGEPLLLKQAVIMRHDVRGAVIAGSGHWLMEERPVETVALIRGFLDASPEERLSPAEYDFPQHGNPGTGSSEVADIRTVVLKGDPNQVGVYTIMLRVPRIRELQHTLIATTVLQP